MRHHHELHDGSIVECWDTHCPQVPAPEKPHRLTRSEYHSLPGDPETELAEGHRPVAFIDHSLLASHKSEGKSAAGDLDPGFWLEMGDVMTQGLTKYPNDPDGKPNWWKGGSYRGFIASIDRHAKKLAAGEDIDSESGLPHAAHIAVDAMFVRSWQRRGVGQDDRLS